MGASRNRDGRGTPSLPPNTGRPARRAACIAVVVAAGLWWLTRPEIARDGTDLEPRDDHAGQTASQLADHEYGQRELKAKSKTSSDADRSGGSRSHPDDRGAGLGGHRPKPRGSRLASAPPQQPSNRPSSTSADRSAGDRIASDSPPATTRIGARGGVGEQASGEASERFAAVTPQPSQPGDPPVASLFDPEGDRMPFGEAVNRGVEREADGARFNPDSEYALPAAGLLNGDSGSVSFWVQPKDTAETDTHASLLQLRSHYEYANRLQLWQSGTNLHLVLANDEGTEQGVVHKSDEWAGGEWRHVTVVWGEGQTELYVNGALAGSEQYDGSLKIRPDTMMHIASNYPQEPGGLNGTVNRVQVFDRALPGDEVAGLAATPPR